MNETIPHPDKFHGPLKTDAASELYIRELLHERQEKERLLLESKELARRDDLTGLYNRAVVGEVILPRIEETEAHLPHFILRMDLNNLKFINDTKGHEEGDRAICTIAEVALLSLRGENDTRKNHEYDRPQDVVARIGGDEFLIFGTGGHEAAHIVKERFERNFDNVSQERFSYLARRLRVGIGGAILEPGSKERDFDAAMIEADDLCYAHKAQIKLADDKMPPEPQPSHVRSQTRDDES